MLIGHFVPPPPRGSFHLAAVRPSESARRSSTLRRHHSADLSQVLLPDPFGALSDPALGCLFVRPTKREHHIGQPHRRSPPTTTSTIYITIEANHLDMIRVNSAPLHCNRRESMAHLPNCRRIAAIVLDLRVNQARSGPGRPCCAREITGCGPRFSRMTGGITRDLGVNAMVAEGLCRFWLQSGGVRRRITLRSGGEGARPAAGLT